MLAYPVQLKYLAKDDIFDAERPYSVNFPVDDIEGARPTNHVYETATVQLRDIRNEKRAFSLDDAGFTYVKQPFNHSPEAFENDEFVITKYFEEVKVLLHKQFPKYQRIILGDYVLRKRETTFPQVEGARTKFAQPLTLPHLDYTQLSSRQRADQLIRAKGLKSSSLRHYDQLNIWRVLKGPNNDWPLALCDSRTIDYEGDAVTNDVILRDVASENHILRRNTAHRWYFMSNQAPEDVLIFRNSDSDYQPHAWAWHGAVDVSQYLQSSPRESIEIRVFACW